MALLVAAVVLSGCSSLSEKLQGDKVDYKSATKGTSLDVPPDLTQLSRKTRYVVPGSAVTASGYQVGQTTQSVPTAATSVGDVRIERSGTQRWLVVNRPA
ncbi:MAG: outer membrane protein assembly factor BamC, partial [Burkholderiales bacterium]